MSKKLFHECGDIPRKRRFSTSFKPNSDNFLTAITNVFPIAKILSTRFYPLSYQDPTIILKNIRSHDFNKISIHKKVPLPRSLFNKVAGAKQLWNSSAGVFLSALRNLKNNFFVEQYRMTLLNVTYLNY